MKSERFTDIEQFENRLGVPVGFYSDLLKEDDWSFVIKISALIEAACTHILAHRLNIPELEENLAYLEQGNNKVGRIALLKKMGALYKEQATILNSLTALRNKLAHGINNVSFRFADYVDSLDKNQKANFVRDFGHGLEKETVLEGKKVTRDRCAIENPKFSIWMTLSKILACLHLEIKTTEIKLKQDALDRYVNLTKASSGN